MFERFTDRARRVVVLAQDEARLLKHNYIGTEHLLLGLIHEGEGVAAARWGIAGHQPGDGPRAGRGDHRRGPRGVIRAHPVHAAGQEGAGAVAARGAGHWPQLHRYRAHPARPDPRGSRRGGPGPGVARGGPGPGPPAGDRPAGSTPGADRGACRRGPDGVSRGRTQGAAGGRAGLPIRTSRLACRPSSCAWAPGPTCATWTRRSRRPPSTSRRRSPPSDTSGPRRCATRSGGC